MSAIGVWAVLAGLMVVVEMLSGTFYLLGVGLGAAAAGTAAALGVPTAGQIFVFALCTAASLLIVTRCKKPTKPALDADIGQEVEVLFENANGSYRVAYRGTEWDALLEGPVPERAPTHMTIVRIAGNRLHCKAK